MAPSVSADSSALIDDARQALEAFIDWQRGYGPVSQDHHDFWVWAPGRRSKAFYHRHPGVGGLMVAPFVALDTFVPSSRRLVRRPTRFPIADAHYAMGFLKLSSAMGDATLDRDARAHLAALERSRSPDFDDWCWGYPFAWETVIGRWEAGRPLITQTPYGYEAFAAAYEKWGEDFHREVIRSVVTFAATRIPSHTIRDGVSVCAYTPFDSRRVINANTYRAFLLVDGGKRFAREDWVDEGLRNVAFVLSTQRSNGSWPYAVDGHDAFVDNFHTCFVLKSLFKISRLTGGDELAAAINRGYAYYKDQLLDDTGLPIPFSEQRRITLYTRELYDFAEGLNLALLLRHVDADADGIADAICRSLISDWVLPDGHFVTRRTRISRNTVPYHRWAQAQAFHALADFVSERGPVSSQVLASS